MPGLLSVLGVALSVLVALSVSVSLGFGFNVVALPLGSCFADVKIVIPVLALLGVAGASIMAVKERRRIDWRELGRIVLWASVGFPLGFYGFSRLPGEQLNVVVGVIVISAAAHGLWTHLRGGEPGLRHPLIGRVLLVLGGAVHGAIVTGGPLIVIYAVHAMPEKGRFRATLFALWSVLNTFFVVGYFLGPSRDPAVIGIVLWCLPVMAAGLWIGQRVHHRLPQTWFRRAVLALLLVAGIARLVA